MTFDQAIARMTGEIAALLSGFEPSIYLYGSCALNDFRLGWSDIDILTLTKAQIPPARAEALVSLRQTMLEREPDNPYYRSFEGGMLALSSFLSGERGRVVYWGTSGQRITDKYSFDSFCMWELLEAGVLLYGSDERALFALPSYRELYRDVARHDETIRAYAKQTDRSLYSYGWLLDISRCIYTLRTGRIIAKTAAGEWALQEGLCPDAEALKAALRVRKNPLAAKSDPKVLDYGQTLGAPVQRYADVLERELTKYKR